MRKPTQRSIELEDHAVNEMAKMLFWVVFFAVLAHHIVMKGSTAGVGLLIGLVILRQILALAWQQ